MRSIREEFAVTSIALDFTKDLLATGCYSENKINFWKISNQTKIQSITFDKAFNPINSILFFKGKVAFIANCSANVVVLHGENFSEVKRIDKGNNREIISIDATEERILVACQRPLLQTTLTTKEQVTDIAIYDTNSWDEVYKFNSDSLLFDAKFCHSQLIFIGLSDIDGMFKITFFDLHQFSKVELLLGEDAYSAQLSTNQDCDLIAVILRVNDDDNGSMVSQLFFIDLNTKKIIYQNSVTNGNDYINCEIMDRDKIVLDYYDHKTKSSYLTVIDSQGNLISKQKIDGITTYGIATAAKVVALAVNNYVEFVELS